MDYTILGIVALFVMLVAAVRSAKQDWEQLQKSLDACREKDKAIEHLKREIKKLERDVLKK